MNNNKKTVAFRSRLVPLYENRPSQTPLEAPELLGLQKMFFRVRAGIIFEWFGWFLMFFEW
jgi:hypothetical protein